MHAISAVAFSNRKLFCCRALLMQKEQVLTHTILLLTNNVIWVRDTYITIPMTLFADNDIGKEIKIHLMKFLCITTTAGGTHTQKGAPVVYKVATYWNTL